MRRIATIVFGLMLFTTSAVQANLVVDATNNGAVWYLPPAAGQTVNIRASGGNAVQGLELFCQIGDTTAGPTLTGFDILTGTIFAGNNTGLNISSGIDPTTSRILYAATTTNSGTVPAGKPPVNDVDLLATLTLDATGLAPGSSYTLRLDVPDYGASTNFAGVTPDELRVGTIVITPEPSTLALLAIGGTALWRRAALRRRNLKAAAA